MSEHDSFIDEVTQEVRRDRLFRLMRRYGWIAVLFVVLVVGGAAYNEWRKARAETAARAEGDAILAAFDADSPAGRAQALTAIGTGGPAQAIVALLAAAETATGPGRGAAIDRLEAAAGEPGLDPLWRDLARLKALTLRGADPASAALPPAERVARLEPLAVPGAPYRTLALEQIALARLEAGDPDGALSLLGQILEDNETPQGLRARARQLIVALGGSLEAS